MYYLNRCSVPVASTLLLPKLPPSPRDHTILGGGGPSATQINVTSFPYATKVSVGGTVMRGASEKEVCHVTMTICVLYRVCGVANLPQ